MQYVPAMAQQLVTLHQRDLTTEAEHAQRVAQTRSSNRPSSRKEPSMPTLSVVQSLVPSFLLSPRAASLTAALVAALLLGPDSALAGFSTNPG